MVAAENFVSELDGKNQPQIQRVVDALVAGLAKEGVEVADALRLALKVSIETKEVAAADRGSYHRHTICWLFAGPLVSVQLSAPGYGYKKPAFRRAFCWRQLTGTR